MTLRRFGPPGTLFSIPLDHRHFVIAQVTKVSDEDRYANFGILDAVFETGSPIDVAALAGFPRLRASQTVWGRGWKRLGHAPVFPVLRERYLRWSSEEQPGKLVLIESDPCDGLHERITTVPELPAEMSDDDEAELAEIPEWLTSRLRMHFGVSEPASQRPGPSVPTMRDELLVQSAVADVVDDAERGGPKHGRERLALAARIALETTDYLDAEIGGPALAAACATKDREVARAFRSTSKTVRAVVKHPKAVAMRVLDPAASELAGLHQESGTLEALRAYVDGLGLGDEA